MSSMVTCYFVASILVFIPTFNANLNKRLGYWIVRILSYIYLAGKLTILIIMLVNVQNSYYLNWESNKCDSLKGLTVFWLVWNYIITIIGFIYAIVFVGSDCCDDFYEYDFDY